MIAALCLFLAVHALAPVHCQVSIFDQPYVRKVNVALQKPSYSSSREFSAFGGPEKANDGDTNTNPGAGEGCFQAASTDREPYWLVDLEQTFDVGSVRLTNRGDCCGDMLTDFDITVYENDPRSDVVGSSDCLEFTTTPVAQGETEEFQCLAVSTGRWVQIKKLGDGLTLCEVEVLRKEDEQDAATMDCSFEDPDVFKSCGFFPAKSRSKVWQRWNGTTLTPGTGPDADHTLGNATEGFYMHVDGSRMVPRDEASLVSSKLIGPYGDRCLTFWYHSYGGQTRNLDVFVYDMRLFNKLETWSADSANVNTWRRAQIPFSLTVDRPVARLVFYSKYIPGINGDVAIDDVTVSLGACRYADNRGVDNIDCDFNDPSGDICGYGQDFKTDSGDWVWTDQPDTTSGYFMNAQSAGTTGPYMATLFSPLYTPSFPRSCLRFRYKLSGGMNSQLVVKVHTEANFASTGGQVQDRKSPTGTKWVEAEIDLATAQPSRVSFNAFTQGGNMDLSIDDVTLVNRECNSVQTINCPFTDSTNMCGFVQSNTDNFDFGLQNTATADLKGPQSDHTSGNGYYLYTESKSASSGAEGALHSPIVETDAPASCLVFWYFLQGAQPQGTLQVMMSNPDLTNQQAVWSISKGYGVTSVPTDPWARVALSINTKMPFRVTFWVNITGTDYSTALDDISLTKGPCITEKPVTSTFSCSLETPDLCGMGQVTFLDHFDWTWIRGPSLPAEAGPEGDHTSGSGYYLYLESGFHHDPGTGAMIYTPTITPTFPKSCLTFTYHMMGSDVGSLTVFFANTPVSMTNAQVVWTRSGQQQEGWRLAQIDLDTRRPYKIFFQATANSGDKGDIAIDDIIINNLECPASRVSSLQCSFNEDCGFVQPGTDNFDWTSSAGSLPVFNAGPLRDRTARNGVYWYMNSALPRKKGQIATLASPLLDMPLPKSCLVFWFHMLQKPGAALGSLAVLLTDPSLSKPKTVWMRGRSQGNAWRRVAVTIDTPGLMRVVFKGTVGTPAQSSIAIDDVQLSKGPCLGDRQVSKLQCDFEDPSVCGFSQRNDDNFDWFWHSGPVPDVSSTGPAGARPRFAPRLKRQGNSGGYYMYMESSNPQVKGEKAVLVSPRIKTMQPKNCLTFWYHMKGATVGSLKVLALLTGNRRYQIWARSGSQGNSWNQATVELDASPVPFQLAFEGTVGAGTTGDIAIDDIELAESPCPGEASVNCDFEQSHICGYTQIIKREDFLWSRTKGGNLTGPASDHTSGRGHFMYAGEYTPKSVLVSPSLDWSAQESCLRFRYLLNANDSGSVTLNVYQAPTGMPSERILVWSKTLENETQADWELIEILINVNFPVQILLESVPGPGSNNVASVDDIRIVPGFCSHMVNCDFTDDTCSWEGGLQRAQGPSDTAGTGPQADHTNGKGHYLVLNGSAPEASVMMKSGILNWPTDVNCLSFWYHMHGADMGTLAVFTASPIDPTASKTLLWSRSGDKDRLWHNVEVEFSTPGHKRIYFEATKGSGPLTNMAVDDIQVRKGERCNVPRPPPDASTIDCDFGQDLCGYKQLVADDSNWVLDAAGSFIRAEKSLTAAKIIRPSLESPVLTGDPSHVCVSFWYHMEDPNAGTLSMEARDVTTGAMVAELSKSGNQSTGWRKAEVDFDLINPVKLRFEAARTLVMGNNQRRLMADIGLDDVTVKRSTCQPVPWSTELEFRCDRPTTPCNSDLGRCNSTTKQCDCTPGVVGLQCTDVGTTCPSNSQCLRGDCYNKGLLLSCACPNGFYGDRCEHRMVFVDCTFDKMAVNILPYGYSQAAFKDIKTPETVNTACPLLAVDEFNSRSTRYGKRGWQGFAREFAHKNDLCAGDATLLEQTSEGRTYQRQFYVYYNRLGRDPTDTVINVTCTAPNYPPARISMKMKEIGASEYSYTPPGSSKWPFYVEFQFSLNIPNSANMDEMKVERCIATNGSNNTLVVRNGCPVHPMGVMLFDGVQKGTEFLMLRVFKVPGTSVNINLKCNIRLCDTSINNFSCYKRAQCFRRKRRSPNRTTSLLTGKVVKDVNSRGTRLVSVNFSPS